MRIPSTAAGEEVARVIAAGRRDDEADLGVEKHLMNVGCTILGCVRCEARHVESVRRHLHSKPKTLDLTGPLLDTMGKLAGTTPRRADDGDTISWIQPWRFH